MKSWLIHCDDAGMHPTINSAIARLMDNGVAKGCSLLSVGNYFDDAVERLRSKNIASVGIHLALQGEYPRLPVRPVLPPEEVPSLVDDCGFLLSGVPPFKITEVEKELRAQVQKVISTGLKVTHLDGHMFFFDSGSWGETIAPLVKTLAEEMGVPVRWREQVHFIWEGFEDFDSRKAYYEALMSKDASPLIVLLHPADDLEAMKEFSNAGARRLADYAIFMDPDVRSKLKSAQIQTLGWDALTPMLKNLRGEWPVLRRT